MGASGSGRGAQASLEWSPFIPERVLQCTELVLKAKPGVMEGVEIGSGPCRWDDWVLEETQRPPGQNRIGMVAWDVVMMTPEARGGRRVILIANDITFQAGTFGPAEDVLFALASARARELVCARPSPLCR